MTSNRPIQDWGKLIGDVPAATAILDRFLHHAEMIQITGKSYRLRNRQGEQSKDDSDHRSDRSTDSHDSKTGQSAPRVDRSKTGQSASRVKPAAAGTGAKKAPSKKK